jgi:glutaredoxin-like protein
MTPLLNEDIRKQLKDILSMMKEDVTLVLFTKDGAPTSEETQQLLTEMTEISPKIHLVVKDFDLDLVEKAAYDITLVPSFVVLDSKHTYKGVKFNGIPAGHEINSFISALIEMSGVEDFYEESLKKTIQAIDKEVSIKVFVTLSCPHCPGAVQTAHRLAMLNPKIKAEMIEAQTFYELSDKYQVSGVPKIIINDKYELLGNHPVENFLKEIEKL